MKKVMIALSAVAIASAAQAVSAYTFIEVARYEGKAQDSSYYKFYTLSQSEAKEAMETDAKVTYATCAAWLGRNFAENSAAIAGYKWVSPNINGDSLNVVDSNGGYASEGSLYDAIVVGIYDNGTDMAYNVFANCDHYDEQACYEGDSFQVVRGSEASSGWIAVPEPTSGLLMLLGLAGLALKRRRV